MKKRSDIGMDNPILVVNRLLGQKILLLTDLVKTVSFFFRYHEFKLINVRNFITNSDKKNQLRHENTRGWTKETSTHGEGRLTIRKEKSSLLT